MRATVDRKEFEAALKWHATGFGTGFLRATVADGVLTIESANETAWKASRLDAEEAQDGRAEFAITRLAEQLKAATKKAKTLTLSSDDRTLTAVVGRSTSLSPLMPEIPKWWGPETVDRAGAPQEEVFTVDASEFTWAVKAMATAASPHRSNDPITLQHAEVVVEPDYITLHGTNQYRMARVRIEASASQETTLTISPHEMLTAMPMMDDPITVTRTGTHYGVSSAKHSTLIVGLGEKMPNIAKVVQNAEKADLVSATVDTEEITAAINSVVARDLAQQVDLDLTEGLITVTNAADSSNTPGTTTVEVEADVHEALRGRGVRGNAMLLASLLRIPRTARVHLLLEAEASQKGLLALRQDGPPEVNDELFGLLALVPRH